MTAMREAFERAAGASPISDTLYTNAIKAIRSRCGDLDKAAEDVLREIQLCGDTRNHLKALALGFVRFVDRDMKGGQKDAAGGQKHGESHGATAPSTLSPQRGAAGQLGLDNHDAHAGSAATPSQTAGGGQCRLDIHDPVAPTEPLSDRGHGTSNDHDSAAPAAQANASGDKGQSSPDDQRTSAPPEAPKPIQRPAALTPERLKAIAINRMTDLGKPVGECTAADLRNLIRKHAVNTMFYEALLQGMPEVGAVKDYYADAEVARVLHIASTHRGLESALITLRKPTDYREVQTNA